MRAGQRRPSSGDGELIAGQYCSPSDRAARTTNGARGGIVYTVRMGTSEDELRYYRTVEDLFATLRGVPHVLSPRDFQLLRTWWRD